MKKDTTQRGTAVPAGKPSLPHERDQQKTATNPTPDAQVDQAARDLKQGQVDTDLRATPGRRPPRRPGEGRRAWRRRRQTAPATLKGHPSPSPSACRTLAPGQPVRHAPDDTIHRHGFDAVC
jgi:hypothetical protein